MATRPSLDLLPRRQRRLGLFAVAAAALALGAGAADGHGPPLQPPAYYGQKVAAGTVAANFTLRDQAGATVSLAGQRGRIVLLTFLYTNCPDVCPLIAQNVDRAVKGLGAKASRVTILAVSVDPRGDTAAVVRRYVKERGLGPRFHYLIGTKAQLQPVWQAYNLLIEGKTPEVIDHSTYVLLIDRTGKPRLYYQPTTTATSMLRDLRKFVG